jgi:hypothetical protein
MVKDSLTSLNNYETRETELRQAKNIFSTEGTFN